MSSNVRDAELRKIEKENNQKLYEFFCERVKGLDKKSEEYKDEFSRYSLAFLYLNEGKLVRLFRRYQSFEDDNVSDGKGKNRNTNKKNPPGYRIREVTAPSVIYESTCYSNMQSDYISEMYNPVAAVLVKCLDEYDPSAALESEFIFNRNRLNVALTRGKAKSIVFFSEILAKCPPELLGEDDEDVQLGIEYVCGLMPFMQRSEDDTCISMREFILEENGKELNVQIFRKRIY